LSGEVERLPFDQYQRYRLVSDLLERLAGEGPALEVLDVGGRTALLRRFLEGPRVTLVDVEPSDEPGLVLGSGFALPFQDGSFDAVAAFDTLEHVPPEHREGFAAECLRVARRFVILVGPYRSDRVDRAEELLQAFLRDKLGLEQRYLEEHRSFGLPDRAAVEAQLRAQGARVRSLGHGNLDRWLAQMCLSMYLDADPALRSLAEEVHAFYNESLYATDGADPVYRHAVVAALDRRDALPRKADVLPQGAASGGGPGPFARVFRELAAFDRERDAWGEERSRWRQAAADLKGDLRGHREVLERAERVEGEQARVIDDLRSDLAGHRETVAELQGDLDEHVEALREGEATLAREREDRRVVVSALEADLDQHRSSLSAVEADLAAHRETVADLERDLEAQKGELAKAREGHAGVEAALRADLEEHGKSLADLEAALERERADRAAAEAGHREVRERLEAELARHAEALAERGAELESVRAHRGELEAELERVNELASTLNAELARGNEYSASLGRTLEHREAELERLRAELRDRWKNLKRALSYKKPSV